MFDILFTTIPAGASAFGSTGACSAEELKHIAAEMNRTFVVTLVTAILACSITLLFSSFYNRGRNQEKKNNVRLRLNVNGTELEIDISNHTEPGVVSINTRDTSNHTTASNNTRQLSNLPDATAVLINDSDTSNRSNNAAAVPIDDDTENISRSTRTSVSFLDDRSISNRSNSTAGLSRSHRSGQSPYDDANTPHRSNRTRVSMSERDISNHSALSIYEDIDTPHRSNRSSVSMNEGDISVLSILEDIDISIRSNLTAPSMNEGEILNGSNRTTESNYDGELEIDASVQQDQIPLVPAVAVAEPFRARSTAVGNITDPQ